MRPLSRQGELSNWLRLPQSGKRLLISSLEIRPLRANLGSYPFEVVPRVGLLDEPGEATDFSEVVFVEIGVLQHVV